MLGVVRADGLLALTPSEATTLSRHEATGLSRRLTVGRAVEPALTVAAAEALVFDGGRLAGILTHSDLLRALIARAQGAARSPR